MSMIEHAEVQVTSSSLRVKDPTTGQHLEAEIQLVGHDLVITVGGGERPHIGCVVLAQPRASKVRSGSWSASCSVLTIPPHKEEPIARGIATKLAEECGKVTVVTAGIHDDDLRAEGIGVYLRLGEELAELLVEHLVAQPHDG
jgi:hypothetical protein